MAMTVPTSRAAKRINLTRHKAVRFHAAWSKADRALAEQVIDLIKPTSFHTTPSNSWVACVKDGVNIAYLKGSVIDFANGGSVPWAETTVDGVLRCRLTSYRAGRSNIRLVK